MSFETITAAKLSERAIPKPEQINYQVDQQMLIGPEQLQTVKTLFARLKDSEFFAADDTTAAELHAHGKHAVQNKIKGTKIVRICYW